MLGNMLNDLAKAIRRWTEKKIRDVLGEIHDVSEFQCHFGTSFWEPASALF